MKKLLKLLKKNWRENRVLFVLTVILIICLIMITVVGVKYFFGSSKDKYGDRLEKSKKVGFSDKRANELAKKIAEDEQIEKCNVKLMGNTVYIDIKYVPGISLDDAKAKAEATLGEISEKEASVYDISYTLYQDKVEPTEGNEGSPGFTIMGARNVKGTGLKWNNNTPIPVEEEE